MCVLLITHLLRFMERLGSRKIVFTTQALWLPLLNLTVLSLCATLCNLIFCGVLVFSLCVLEFSVGARALS